MQIPILHGIYTDNGPDLRTSYPVNLVPVPKNSGVSAGYLRPADGLVQLGTGPGNDRGGINWNGVCYRVMGTKLVRVEKDGTVVTLAEVGGSDPVTMDYSFDRLAIASNGRLHYWNGTLTTVLDGDLRTVVDVVWVDGYFTTTDGVNLIVTELTDPTSINPLKYGSAEADPDPVKALLKRYNEVLALNRYTIETFDNVGGDFFPLQRVEGAQIQKGVVGTHACCVFEDAVAFLGGARNEPCSVYIGANATATQISTREIDTLLLEYTEAELATVKLEARVDKANKFLYVHLPDRTMVYDAEASKAVGEHVWFTLTSALAGFSRYRAWNFVWCYDQWLAADPTTTSVGYLSDEVSNHWGSVVRWEFNTAITYNGGMGALVHQLELVALTGRVALGASPTISTSYSIDGETWSQDKYVNAGTQGDRLKRLVWLGQGSLRNWRIQRFRGDSNAHVSFVRLEAQIEALAV